MIPTLEELRAYVIAYAGSVGQGYVGESIHPATTPEDHTTLVNAFVLTSGYVMTPQGQVARPFILFPIEMCLGHQMITVRHHARLFLGDLDADDFKAVATDLRGAIANAEGIRQAIRQQRSGLVIAPAGTKLPPMPGRG